MSKEMFLTPVSMQLAKSGKSRMYKDCAGQTYFQMIKDPVLKLNEKVEVIVEESVFNDKVNNWIKLKPVVKQPATPPIQPPKNNVALRLDNTEIMWSEKERRDIRTRIWDNTFSVIYTDLMGNTQLDKLAEEVKKYAEKGFDFVYENKEKK